MKQLRAVFASASAGFFSYMLLGLIMGNNSIPMLNQIRENNARLKDNIVKLEIQQNLLNKNFESLRINPESITIHARALNLYSADDNVIQIKNSGNTLPSSGEILYWEEPRIRHETTIRLISLLLSAIVLVTVMLKDSVNASRTK